MITQRFLQRTKTNLGSPDAAPRLSAVDLHLKGVGTNPLFGLSALKSEVSSFKGKSRRPEAPMGSQHIHMKHTDLHPFLCAAVTSDLIAVIVYVKLLRLVRAPNEAFKTNSTGSDSHDRDY